MPLPTPLSAAQLFNLAEAALWLGIGAWLIFLAFLQSRPFREGIGNPGRVRTALTGLVFLAFGASDLVEIRTGAWWKPWWLLTWKAACIALLFWLWRTHRRQSA